MCKLDNKLKWFNPDDFKCKCGCGLDVDIFTKRAFDKAREYAGVPFVVNSGARCVEHNKNVGGSPTSSHTKLENTSLAPSAGDIKFTTFLHMIKIIYGLTKAGFYRIGVNNSKKFIHADSDCKKPPAIFDY